MQLKHTFCDSPFERFAVVGMPVHRRCQRCSMWCNAAQEAIEECAGEVPREKPRADSLGGLVAQLEGRVAKLEQQPASVDATQINTRLDNHASWLHTLDNKLGKLETQTTRVGGFEARISALERAIPTTGTITAHVTSPAPVSLKALEEWVAKDRARFANTITSPALEERRPAWAAIGKLIALARATRKFHDLDAGCLCPVCFALREIEP